MNFLSWIYTARSYIETYLGFLKGTRVWSLLWLIVVCILIWFYGESIYIGSWYPLRTIESRMLAVGAAVLGWIGYVIVSWFRRRRAEKSLIEGLTGEAIDPEATAREEVADLQSGLKDALLKMRSITKKRFNFVYDFPWYMIIGAPGSGKTTALLNAGLNFPLGEDVDGDGRAGVGGVAGTRNCDWWFTDEAILIDTAGRYTTQDSDNQVDSSAWQGFLALLKKNRPLKPVNGILVTLSIEDALTKSPQARLKEVRTVRQRLRDLEDALKVRLPVYLIFTKVDMISGFSEFFDSFNKFDREQVLGTTFPLGVSQSAGKAADALAAQYDLILERLNRMLIERMQQEPDDIRRSRVFRFPAQFAALKQAIVEQVAELTAASKLTTAPILRGVYFVSGTQSGLVHDRIRSSVSERFAFLPDQPSSGAPGLKPYFLSRLFNEVIFNEANLVTTDPKLQRRKRILMGLAYALPLAVCLGIGAGWAHAWITNRQTVGQINQRIEVYNRDVADMKVADIQDGDIGRIVGPLNELRTAQTVDLPGTDKWYHFGLAQERKLDSSLDAKYRKALNNLLLPRLLVYLQNAMQQPGIDAGDLYNKLKLYLMLGDLGPMDRDFVRTTFETEAAKQFPGAGRVQFRQDLIDHINALTATPIDQMTLDESLIVEARDALRSKPPAERIHQVVISSPQAAAQVEWRPADKAGSGGELLLQRKSGATLRDGIPGLYTRKGFFSAVLTQVDSATNKFLDEKWVLGDDYVAGLTADDVKRDVLRRYMSDFQKRWSDMVQDLGIRQATDLQQATSIVGLMTSGNNPLQSLAAAIGKDTDLTPHPDAPPADAAAAATGDGAAGALNQATQVAGQVAGQAGQIANQAGKALDAAKGLLGGDGGPVDIASQPVYLLDDFGEAVLDPYKALRDYTTPKGEKGDQPSDFAALGEVFNELFRQLSRAASNPNAVNSMFGVEGALAAANQRLISEAQRVPTPLDNWLGSLATDIARLTASGARQSLSELWSTTGGRFCKQAIAGRYPFVRNADNDVAINDFTRMFGPGGEFANFFDLHLKNFVDVQTSPWKWTGAAGDEAIASDSLAMFESANRIRSAFFATGADLAVTLDVTPTGLDNTSESVLLSLNDQQVNYDHGPVQTKSMQWPGTGNREARLVFQPPAPNSGTKATGPWAVFRLFDQATIKKVSEDKFNATFQLGKRWAAFDVQTGSVLNPFSLPDLADFRCPERL